MRDNGKPKGDHVALAVLDTIGTTQDVQDQVTSGLRMCTYQQSHALKPDNPATHHWNPPSQLLQKIKVADLQGPSWLAHYAALAGWFYQRTRNQVPTNTLCLVSWDRVFATRGQKRARCLTLRSLGRLEKMGYRLLSVSSWRDGFWDMWFRSEQ
jgi:hypothetical protein